MRTLCGLISIGLAGLLCLQCSTPAAPDFPSDPPISPPGELTETDKSLLESTNSFGLTLFREVAALEDPDSNIFLSPLSVSFALGMTLNGAAGETREAMETTLALSGLTPDEINHSYRNVIDVLTQADPEVVFEIANSIWHRSALPVNPEFIEINQTYFDASVRGLDFDAPWAADTINYWVNEHTHGKIPKIINPPIPWDIVMFLINAVYFNGNWHLPFDTGSTIDMNFILRDGTMEPRPFMRTDTTFNYFENDLFQAIDLPYGDAGFSMIVFLPKTPYSIDEVIGQLTDDTWAAWLAGFSEAKVMLSLPKFKFSYGVKLNDVLTGMGMGIAFDPLGADFSPMLSGSIAGQLYINHVVHKAFVQVDEKGTEAAAVTVVGMGVTSIDPDPVMIVDRPFMFAIYEHESKSLLFMGKVVDPVWQ